MLPSRAELVFLGGGRAAELPTENLNDLSKPCGVAVVYLLYEDALEIIRSQTTVTEEVTNRRGNVRIYMYRDRCSFGGSPLCNVFEEGISGTSINGQYRGQ